MVAKATTAATPENHAALFLGQMGKDPVILPV
jgi:hypothetical protein